MLHTQKNIIEINKLRFGRGDRIIFSDVNLNIERGKITAIMGPSGTGKTTLLKLISGLITPDAGEVYVEGRLVNKMSQTALYEMRRYTSMLFQSSALFTGLNVFDNVAFPLLEHTQLSKTMIRDLVLMKLQAVGLRGARNLFPRELSGGMTRRAALARAIALDPKIILYDEPFTGQDPIAMGVLLQLIKLLNDALGLTSVIVSHDIEETMRIADYVYVLAGGKVIGHGATESVGSDPDPRMRQFLQGLPDGPVPFHYPAQDYKDDLMIG